jgi:hypothetical protein
VTDLRLRSLVADSAIEESLRGRVLGPADYDMLLTGPAHVRKPNGQTLCVYLPGAVAEHSTDPGVYAVLHELRHALTKNRGNASGTERLGDARRTYAKPIPSAVIGATDPMGQRRYCRLTAWTGTNLPAWQQLHPLLRTVARHFADRVPDRYAAQAAEADRSDPAWVVPGTPFTTVTVNNTYPTGVHKDKGDLPTGFSTICCVRRGAYAGGQLVFPAWRVAADLHDGDLLLMDAHDWHGNVPIVCPCGAELTGPCPQCSAERISVVAYFRTKISGCLAPDAERARAEAMPKHGGVTADGQVRAATEADEAAAAAR